MMKIHNLSKWASSAAIFLFVAAGFAARQSSPNPAPAPKHKRPASAAHKIASQSAPAAANASADAPKPSVSKRDPFVPLVSDKKEGGSMERLPPGKAGLVITSVRVDGTVQSQEGMIAVLSNADQHVYFVREGDQLYDGNVDKIGLDGVTFRQNSKDAFGKPVERVVTKRIYASAGEQQ
jgi:hypothetical protein